ncbi:MAG: ATP-binding protein [Desulfobacterota bacterium]|jgi:signal transduction histidine kinase|nr:ATP-binding protein [Thermodesulfobacteriota bacterium]
MEPSLQHKPLEGKQFRLVKFFAWASFIVLAIFSFPFSMVLSQEAKETLLTSYQNTALLIGKNLNHQVFQNFVVPIMTRYGGIKLSDSNQYNLMDQVVKNTIHGFNVDVVNIYDISKGVIAYSTDTSLTGHKVTENMGYRKAVEGESSSSVTSNIFDLWGLGIDILGGQKKVRTFIPFTGLNPFTGPTQVGGVFELIQDMSEEYKSIVRFQYLVFGISLAFMGLIFLALLVIVHKAERIIEERARAQRELEEQLHQSERLAALGEMIAAVSHEIKNPLGIIRSTAELMGTLPEAGETHKKLSSVITEESTRLNRIVTEFLDFARPQTPDIRECDLRDILEKNLEFLKPELDKKGITVKAELDGVPLTLMADHGQLYRAFLNIFINASQSMDKGGSLQVHAREDRGRLYVEIEDTGCGISQENLKRIFNPFFTTKDKGTGLGLSIVRKIIEGHKGTIGIQSQEGKGTKVEILLPRQA